MKYIVKQNIITFVISGLAVQIRPWAPENEKGLIELAPFLFHPNELLIHISRVDTFPTTYSIMRDN
jgi:hypothetical protein